MIRNSFGLLPLPFVISMMVRNWPIMHLATIAWQKENQLKYLNPIQCQALGYAEYIRGEQIHPRTLAVNTAFILQGIQFFCPLNKYFILSWYVESIIFDITCFTSKQQILKVMHMDLLFSSSLPLLCLHSSASLLEKWAGNLKILLSDLQTMIYISVDIQFKDLKFDTHMKDIFVLAVKRFEVVCTSNLETAHNLMSLGWICSPLTQNRVKWIFIMTDVIVISNFLIFLSLVLGATSKWGCESWLADPFGAKLNI